MLAWAGRDLSFSLPAPRRYASLFNMKTVANNILFDSLVAPPRRSWRHDALVFYRGFAVGTVILGLAFIVWTHF